MIDAGPSRQAATLFDARMLAEYVARSGWTILPSRIEGTVIVRSVAEPQVFFVLPLEDEAEDSLSRKADALRTIAAVQNKPVRDVALAVLSSRPESSAGGPSGRRQSAGSDTPSATSGPPGRRSTRRGIVKWFNPAKGFGFISPLDGGKDVFVHIAAVERAGLATLNAGQEVEYELVADGSNRETVVLLRS